MNEFALFNGDGGSDVLMVFVELSLEIIDFDVKIVCPLPTNTIHTQYPYMQYHTWLSLFSTDSHR